jgi:2-isopropylmalate synthase
VRPRITVFVPVSEIQARAVGLTLDQVAQRARDCVARARDLVQDVQLSLGDAPRALPDVMAGIARTGAEAGAGTVCLVDSAGIAAPGEFADVVTLVQDALAGRSVRLSVHCHDDLGLAVANAFAGVLVGADQVECAVNGLGERAGNTALEEIAMLLRVKGPALGIDCGVLPAGLPAVSALVEHVTGYVVAANKAIVGRNAFTHSAGVHQDAVLADPASYQVIGQIGQTQRLTLGKHTSLAGLRAALAEAGRPVTVRQLAGAYRRLKELGDAGRGGVDLDELLPTAQSTGEDL